MNSGKPVSKTEVTADRIRRVVEQGNWIIRADKDGVSYRGFKWGEIGEWTEAPDWNQRPECGGGLHGQDAEHGGYIHGTRLVFCETDGEHVPIDNGKVKVRRARILLINQLPEGLVCEWLDLRGCTGLTSIPELPRVERLDLSGCTGLTSIPELPRVEWLDLRGCTGLTSIPELPRVRWLDLSGCTGLTSIPDLPRVRWLDLSGCTGLTSIPDLPPRCVVIDKKRKDIARQ